MLASVSAGVEVSQTDVVVVARVSGCVEISQNEA
jgi:hypothetical protein